MYFLNASITRPGIGTHRVLHQKSNVILRSIELRLEVDAYLGGTLRSLECDLVQVGGVENHVHLLCGPSKKISLSELIKNLKTSSTRIVKSKGHPHFGWQSGYGAFSVSESAKEAVVSYINDQEIHHRQITFQEEFRILLEKHRMPFDERYVWD